MDLYKIIEIEKRIKDEIRQCDTRLEQAKPSEHPVIILEKETLEAELKYRWAKYKYEDKVERLANIYTAYGEEGINEKNYDEYLSKNSEDDFAYTSSIDFLTPITSPNRVKRDLSNLEYEVKITEKEWTKKLEVWESSAALSKDKSKDETLNV